MRIYLAYFKKKESSLEKRNTPSSKYTSEAASRGIHRKRCSENVQQIYRRTPMPKCDFNKIALQLYWNHASAWVLSCKFVAYFQNTFSQEHVWTAASDTCCVTWYYAITSSLTFKYICWLVVDLWFFLLLTLENKTEKRKNSHFEVFQVIFDWLHNRRESLKNYWLFQGRFFSN